MSSAELVGPAAAITVPGAEAPARAGVVLRACRPRQWTKNLLLLAAPAAAGSLTDLGAVSTVALAIVAFCMLSSATYLLNDVRDREQDRCHPNKRSRPVACGALAPRHALALAVGLALTGLGISALVRWQLALLGLAYLVLTASYSLWWRRLIGLDILAIAGGFVVRAAAGGAAADVGLSRWFLLVTSCGAVFVVAAKRHAELSRVRQSRALRATLRSYSTFLLRSLMATAAIGAISAYVLWAAQRPEHGPWYEITIMPVVFWLGRYATLVARGAGEAPEELILGDRVLLSVTLAWALLFAGGVYVGS